MRILYRYHNCLLLEMLGLQCKDVCLPTSIVGETWYTKIEQACGVVL